MGIRFLVLAGHRRSLPSLYLVSSLLEQRKGGKDSIVVLSASEFSFRRLAGLRRRLGSNLIPKAITALGFSMTGQFGEERAVFRERLEDVGVKYNRIDRFCRDNGIPFNVVSEFNHPATYNLLRSIDPDQAIYTGGGILKKEFIALFPKGVLNTHSGPLPHIRGMSAVEWTLYFGMKPTATVHFIDEGIDTGGIIGSISLEVECGEPLGRIRARTVLAGFDLMLSKLDALWSGSLGILPNPPGRGRQYFEMADSVKGIVQHWIDHGYTPVVIPEEVDPDDLRSATTRIRERSEA